jgi:hypothetical protein
VPVDTTCKFRFGANNLLVGSSRVTYSSEKTNFEFANALTDFRTQVWKPTGFFDIDATNNKIYYDDGSAQTSTITVGTYATAALLVIEIQTQLDADSSNFTVSYSSTTYKFTIARTTNYELTLSSTTNAAWTTLGYTTGTDLTGSTSYAADTQRNHYPYEWVKYDGGGSADISFAALIGDLSETFQVSGSAVVTLEGNTVDSWTSPAASTTLTKTTDGMFAFNDDSISNYRWSRLTIDDKVNPLGPEFNIGYLYMGPYTNLTSNIQVGFSAFKSDPSVLSYTDGGQFYVDVKTKVNSYNGLSIIRVGPADKLKIDQIYENVGLHKPFFLSIDPTVVISNNIGEFTKFVRFTSPPQFSHSKYNQFDVVFNVEEVL